MTRKNSPIFGAWMNRLLTKLTTPSSLAISMVAKFMKATISPMLASLCRCSHTPTRKMPTSDRVEAARVATAAIAHHDNTGICAESTSPMMSCKPRDFVSIRVKDWITGRLPSTSEARSASWAL